jgi:hypothetical protein
MVVTCTSTDIVGFPLLSDTRAPHGQPRSAAVVVKSCFTVVTGMK